MKKAVSIAGIFLGASVAPADMLLPGETQYKTNGSVPPSVTHYTTTLPPFAGGPNQVGALDSPITGEFHGNVTSHVFADPATGFLSFQYIFSLTDMNTAAMVRATMNGWQDVSITDTGANASGSSGTFDPQPEWTDGDPLFISRDPQSQGLAIQWRSAIFNDQIGTVIGPGDISSEIFFMTNVRQFQQGQVDMIDTAITGQAQVLVPVPEPTSLVLLGAGLAFLAVKRRV